MRACPLRAFTVACAAAALSLVTPMTTARAQDPTPAEASAATPPQATTPAPVAAAAPPPAPATPTWADYIGYRLRFHQPDGRYVDATVVADEGAYVGITTADGGRYSIDKRNVARIEVLSAPGQPAAPAPAPAAAADPAAFRAALVYELSQGESSTEYKRARGMLIGGAVMASVGGLLTLSGLLVTITADSLDAADVDDGDQQTLLVTGLGTFAVGGVMLGAGIPLAVVGGKRKKAITAEATQKLRMQPTASRHGGGLSFHLAF